jgi:hypothetical protein
VLAHSLRDVDRQGCAGRWLAEDTGSSRCFGDAFRVGGAALGG